MDLKKKMESFRCTKYSNELDMYENVLQKFSLISVYASHRQCQ